MKLSETVALVTGGASGLGRATASYLVHAGAKVILLDLPDKGLEDLSLEMGSNASFIEADITDAQSLLSSLNNPAGSLTNLNCVVNCAGVAMAQTTVHRGGAHDLESFAYCVKVNTIGTFNVIRLAADKMSANEPNETEERGVIINTASVAAYDGQRGQVAYAASKGALVSMTLPLARDLARYGIRVMTIAPGIFNTPMMALLPEEAKTALSANVPFPPRLGEPAEFAHLAGAIIENPMLNGEVIRLDGALRMPPR